MAQTSKLVGYGATGSSQESQAVSKLIGYMVDGGTPESMTSSKLVAYAILNADRTVTLDSNSATGSVGSLTVAAAQVALTGVSGTGAVNTFGNTHVVALPDGVSSGTVGQVGFFGRDLLIDGNEAMGEVGDLLPDQLIDIELVGNSATGSVGTLGAQADENVTVALTGVQGIGQVGTLTPEGGSFPDTPFNVQVLMDGPRYTAVKASGFLLTTLPASVLIDPAERAPIQPDWPVDLKPTRYAIDLIDYDIPPGLEINLLWAGPTPQLICTLTGEGQYDLREGQFFQNENPGTAGQILISSGTVSATIGFTLLVRAVKQGGWFIDSDGNPL